MNAVAALYQKGRDAERIAVRAESARCTAADLCAPHVLPPLKPLSESQLEKLAAEMERLHLLNGNMKPQNPSSV